MINEKLKKLRLGLGYSQIWVSKKLGYKNSYSLYRKEKGKRNFSIRDIQELCKLYNITVDELLSEEAGGAESDAKKN
ncbi:TPA: helix-turn-helix transcriptional regulator [Clostridioides difficile]|nr:helix-turn-helix transcriptional regulator [Clostridioides difficile]